MKKYITLLFLGVFIYTGISAQENIPTNFYSINPQMYNPAHTGQKGSLSIYLNNRNQWYGLKGAPESLNIGVHSGITGNLGIGVNYNNYTSGIFNESTITSAFSYGLKFGTDHNLRLGASLGAIRNSINTVYDGVTDNSDLALNTNYFNETFIKTGFGLSYKFKDMIQFDVSIPDIYSAKNNKYLQTIITYLSYDYKFNAIGKEMIVTPAVMYRNSQFALNSIDFTVALDVTDIVWVMVGYRNTSGVIMGAGIKRKNFAFSYTYELDLSPISLVSSGTHEITAFYSFNFRKKEVVTE